MTGTGQGDRSNSVTRWNSVADTTSGRNFYKDYEAPARSLRRNRCSGDMIWQANESSML
jgi:hypothetical protein